MYIRGSNKQLIHSGKTGMKWGYNDGKRNGKRTAEDEVTIGFVNDYGDTVYVTTDVNTGKMLLNDYLLIKVSEIMEQASNTKISKKINETKEKVSEFLNTPIVSFFKKE